MNYFFTLAIILFGYMTTWFVLSILKKRNDITDIAWGLGFVLLAWVSFAISESMSLRGILVGVLVTVWGTRLAWHIYSRNRGKPEDYRYAAWRKEWGSSFFVRSFFQIYMLQGVLLYLVVMPVLFINHNRGGSLGLFDLAGCAVWIIGFLFESIGDAQLARFIKNPANKGKLIQSGLWQYTRHPNYFGEVTQWWGIWIIALSVPGGWLSIIGPLTITILILKVSGIPMLEKKMAEKPEFTEYSKRTSVFIPLPPRRG
jgi:steroid 5-alpha reductase family enzyme